MKIWTIIWGLGALLALYGVLVEGAWWHAWSAGLCLLMAWGCASESRAEKEREGGR